MNITSCPQCGGRVRSISIGWKCESCQGFIDLHGMQAVSLLFALKQEEFIRVVLMQAEKLGQIVPTLGNVHLEREKQPEGCIGHGAAKRRTDNGTADKNLSKRRMGH